MNLGMFFSGRGLSLLLEVVTHSFEKALVILVRFWCKGAGIFQFLDNPHVFFAQTFWYPDIDINQQISSSVTIYLR